jgi:hypothetical protein
MNRFVYILSISHPGRTNKQRRQPERKPQARAIQGPRALPPWASLVKIPRCWLANARIFCVISPTSLTYTEFHRFICRNFLDYNKLTWNNKHQHIWRIWESREIKEEATRRIQTGKGNRWRKEIREDPSQSCLAEYHQQAAGINKK